MYLPACLCEISVEHVYASLLKGFQLTFDKTLQYLLTIDYVYTMLGTKCKKINETLSPGVH